MSLRKSKMAAIKRSVDVARHVAVWVVLAFKHAAKQAPPGCGAQ